MESHIRERIDESDGTPNERDALEAILTRLGSPAAVARAYSLEMVMEEAAVGGRLLPVMRSLLHAAASGVRGFRIAIGLFCGYMVGAAFVALAALKPVFPRNVGLWFKDGLPRSFGAEFPAPHRDGAGWRLLGDPRLTHRRSRDPPRCPPRGAPVDRLIALEDICRRSRT